MTVASKRTGNTGEDLAVDILIKKGYQIIERNYRFGKGEIDIIAKDGDALVFVEVKARKNLEYGPPELAITKAKQRQIKKISDAYIYEKEINDTNCRIDLIAILFREKEKPLINHILNAF